MTLLLQIDQVGLSTGVAGQSRTDGLSTGAVVTLTNTGSGATTLFRLLWVPPGDETAVGSLEATEEDPKVWTFTPTEEVYGTYLVELVQNAGLVTELRERRVLVVRTPNLGLVIPALGERGDPRASLILAGDSQIQAADNNAVDFDDAALNDVPYAAWWRSMHELALAVDDGAAGSSPPTGSEDGYLARYVFVHASEPTVGSLNNEGHELLAATTWTTPEHIPPGSEFEVVTWGSGPAGSYGQQRTSAAVGIVGQPGTPGAARVEGRFTRGDLIAALPIVMNIAPTTAAAASLPTTAGEGQRPSPTGASTSFGNLLVAGGGGGSWSDGTGGSGGGSGEQGLTATGSTALRGAGQSGTGLGSGGGGAGALAASGSATKGQAAYNGGGASGGKPNVATPYFADGGDTGGKGPGGAGSGTGGGFQVVTTAAGAGGRGGNSGPAQGGLGGVATAGVNGTDGQNGEDGTHSGSGAGGGGGGSANELSRFGGKGGDGGVPGGAGAPGGVGLGLDGTAWRGPGGKGGRGQITVTVLR